MNEQMKMKRAQGARMAITTSGREEAKQKETQVSLTNKDARSVAMATVKVTIKKDKHL